MRKACRLRLGYEGCIMRGYRDECRRGPDTGDQKGPKYVRELGVWTLPFIMALINTRVVRRSNALLGYSWGASWSMS
jgi:short subunit dehydrogenase-like uncharacterized protein